MEQHLSVHKLFLVLGCFSVGNIVAQDEYVQAPIPSGPWGSAYIMFGASRLEQRDLLITDFRGLAPGAEMLEQDFTGFTQSVSYWSAPSVVAVSAIAGVHPFRNGTNRGPELRMGLQFASGVVGTLDYERSLRYPLDTLTSSSTGAVFVIDSIHTTQYSFRHSSDRIGAEGSLIFRTGGRSRWSVYGGLGLGFGARMNAVTTLTWSERGSVNFPNGGSQFQEVSSKEERYTNSGGAWFTMQVPFGFGFQLARHGDFLRRMDLFIEGRLGTLVHGTKELGTITSFGAQTLFGLRVRID
jgi:hypothetical protein